MKDSGIEWVGQIPACWNVKKLKHCFEIVSGATPKSGSDSYWDGEIVWITPADYTTEMKYVSAGRKNITQEGFDSCSTVMIPAGSLIFSKRAPIGLIAVNTVDLCTNQGCFGCIPHSGVSSEYYYYVISCATEYFNLLGSGTTFKEISADSFANCKIPFPSVHVQERIVEYLRKKCAEIDALIDSIKKNDIQLNELRQSIIYEAVTKGLNSDVPMQDSGDQWIGQIPLKWNTWRMKYLANEPLKYGANATGTDFSEDLPRYVRITDITNQRTLSEAGKQSLPENISEGYMLEDGDILFARSGATAGKSFFYESKYGPCCFAGYLIKLSVNPQKAISKFLYYYTLTQAYEKWTQQIFIQATIQNISADKYNNLVFAIPESLEEQQMIVGYLDEKCKELDSLISANQKTIKRLKEYRQSVIYEAVTGKIEV